MCRAHLAHPSTDLRQLTIIEPCSLLKKELEGNFKVVRTAVISRYDRPSEWQSYSAFPMTG